jgi:pre-mRNA-processing factor 40
MQVMQKIDFLALVEERIKEFEMAHQEQVHRERVTRKRAERENRDAFKELLGNLIRDGKTLPRTMWKEVYPLFKDDPRYVAMMGQAGSTPQELFWEMLHDFEMRYKRERRPVMDFLRVS